MKRYSTCEFYGLYGFRHVDLDIVATVVYGNDYLDVTEMSVYSSRRGEMVKASDRLTLAFQERHWDQIEAACEDHARKQAEMYRETREEIGCRKATEFMERRAERSIA